MNDYTDFVETYPHIQDAKPAFWSKKSKVGHTHTCTEPTHSLDISPMKYPEPEQASNKKGKPMSYANVAAVHVAPQVQSDTAKKIEYLLGRVNDVYESFRYKVLSKMFNMDEFGKPKTHEQLIEAIKNGDFEIDEKKAAKEKEYVEKYGYAGYDPYYAIKFTKLPTPDRDGFEAAKAELKKARQQVRDIIAVKSADEGLEALQAFEAWTPSNAPQA